jgi:hypothetical protein
VTELGRQIANKRQLIHLHPLFTDSIYLLVLFLNRDGQVILGVPNGTSYRE